MLENPQAAALFQGKVAPTPFWNIPFFIIFHENFYFPLFLSAETLAVVSYDTVIAFENGFILCV